MTILNILSNILLLTLILTLILFFFNNRFKTWILSLFNAGMNKVEDPKIMLENALRDLRVKRSNLNNQLAKLKATEKVATDKLSEKTIEFDRKLNQIKALKGAGNEEKALEMTQLIMPVKKEKEELETNLQATIENVTGMTKMVEVANEKIKELEKKLQSSLAKSEIAKIQKEVAGTMESFEADDSIFDIQEIKNKLDMQSAENSAKLDVAILNQKSNIAEFEAEKLLQKDEAKKLLDTL
jgi:phage shock protein A